jgi:hypothetical protein
MRRARAERAIAALACAAAAAAGAAELGTLFHTPEERERLDRLRRGEPVTPGATAPAPPRQITGFVKRSDGSGTAFIDGVPVPVAPANSRLLEPGAVSGYAERKGEDLRIERKPPR